MESRLQRVDRMTDSEQGLLLDYLAGVVGDTTWACALAHVERHNSWEYASTPRGG
jgi:hypothetical protein